VGAPGAASGTRDTTIHSPFVISFPYARGLVRYQHTGNFHFITVSCFHRLPHLSSSAARDLFEDALERTRRSRRFVVAGYVVMPEHVHLLISEPPRGSVAGVIHALKLSVTLRRVERPFWQERYYDFNVHNESKRIEKLRYMHRNPVKRGLVARPEDWPWSSFRHYATGLQGVAEIESEWTASRRGFRLPKEYESRRLAH
jgi:putative transposase